MARATTEESEAAALRRPKPRAQAVAEALREFVTRERLVPGDKLPSEIRLVEILGVSRSSVREGIQLLKSLGIVDVEHGKGMFLGSSPGRAIQQVIDWAYRPEDRKRLLRDLLDARMIFERAQARLAAERATDEEIATLRHAYGTATAPLELARLSLSATSALGLDYHQYIARIAHNDILLIMVNAVWPLYTALVSELNRTRAEVRRGFEPHAQISDAIARRDPDGAEQAMMAHLDEIDELFETWIARARRREGGRGRELPSEDESVRLEPWKPRAEAVAEALRELVIRDRIVPGDKLPSETDLVNALQVGRSSVREGIQLLESLGIVDVEHGKGMFLGSSPSRGIEQVIDWAYPPEDEARLLADLFEARIVVEGAQARFAAERAADEEIAAFVAAFGSREQPPGLPEMPWPDAQAIGLDYHHALGRLAHNDILLLMSNAVRPLTRRPVELRGEAVAGIEHAHIEITAAIAARDGAAAHDRMVEHLRENRRVVTS